MELDLIFLLGNGLILLHFQKDGLRWILLLQSHLQGMQLNNFEAEDAEIEGVFVHVKIDSYI
jgi:hypothetical protein